MLNRHGRTRQDPCSIGLQPNRKIVVVILDFGHRPTHFDSAAQLLDNLAAQSSLRLLVRLDFPPGKLPFPGKRLPLRALTDQHPAVPVQYHRTNHIDHAQGLAYKGADPQPEMPACPNPAPLEDDACDVIAKAMRGRGVSTERLAMQTGLSMTAVRSALDGTLDPDALEKIARALELSPPALIGLSSYAPAARAPEGLHRFVTPFGHAGANAYVITHGRTASVFDTGTDATPILQFLHDNNLQAEAVYITHRHPDHTAGIGSFGDTPVIFPEDIEHGAPISAAHPSLIALDVSGHAQPARAYFYEGLACPVCIVGDSVFAGSMGGTRNPPSYQLALQTAREHLFSLPPATVLCPGHGPLTTVAMEQCHNPFQTSPPRRSRNTGIILR